MLYYLNYLKIEIGVNELIESRIDIKTRIKNLEMITKRHQLLTSSDLDIVERRLGELKVKLRYSRYGMN